MGDRRPGASLRTDVQADIEAMRAHVEAAPEIYRPGEYWAELIAANVEMLRSDGIENLKRTVSNNYYNWLVATPRDPQVVRAIVRWLRRPGLEPLRTWMEPADRLRTAHSGGQFGFSPRQAWLYRFFVGQAWERAREEDRLGLTERLEEPEAGNPLRLRSRGRLISQDLANSIIECNFAAVSGQVRDGARIAELGAGYGRLAYVHAHAAECVYCIFDIPPALAVAQWYLTEVLGTERVVPFSPEPVSPEVLEPGQVALFTPDQLEAFPDGWFDLTQTISTLPEMPRAQSEHFLGLLAAKSSTALFLKQWRRWRNEADRVELTEDDYRLPAGWTLTHRRTDPIQPLFFNRLWQLRA